MSTSAPKFVAYLRVSTQQQGRSGLGLEAQRSAVETFAAHRGALVTQWFTEVESGKRNTRPELVKALHLAKVTGATLVIAKLDRLSRNAAFLLTLRDSGSRFIAADLPDANELTVGIMALVAQQEREAISRRTKEALQAAKRRGTKLGNPNGAAALRRASKGNAASLEAIRDKADKHAQELKPVLDALTHDGITSLGAVAAALNERGMLTPRGGRWYKTSVHNLVTRIQSAG
ncbi:recombinase family protein [uncultured Nevskia sp.]|uniref:recombinase family protein n=1 Tax=uncultured Nevskia sp. TaxID=228950 RepID=UPI0025F8529C|nr:recombinase family protein [uncultured Nevskia sp.]